MSKVILSESSNVWKLLNGICVLYKTTGETSSFTRTKFLYKLSQELCGLEGRTQPYILVEGDTTKPLKISVFPNYAYNPLVSGPRYRPEDFKCAWATHLGTKTSGVLGLNKGTKEAYKLHQTFPMRVYNIKGTLGEATDSGYYDGRIIRKKRFNHVRKGMMDKVLASLQASHQRSMFDACGVDLQSETAYKMAAEGVVRPANSKIPVIYGIKCVDFDPPNFTLEVKAVNEYENYFLALVHTIGLQLRCVAFCSGIQCIRHSIFNLNNALLKKHWTLESVIQNLGENAKLLKDYNQVTHTYKKLDEENLRARTSQ